MIPVILVTFLSYSFYSHTDAGRVFHSWRMNALVIFFSFPADISPKGSHIALTYYNSTNPKYPPDFSSSIPPVLMRRLA
jgi:hypothetical protein